MTEIGPLFHWSPRSRRKRIDKLGLMPSQPSNREKNLDDGWLAPYICFGVSPAIAWNYSVAVFKVPDIYDLWEVYPIETDAVHVLPNYGSKLTEVRINNRVPKSRLIYVGSRQFKT